MQVIQRIDSFKTVLSENLDSITYNTYLYNSN